MGDPDLEVILTHVVLLNGVSSCTDVLLAYQVGPNVTFQGNVADVAGAFSVEDSTLVVSAWLIGSEGIILVFTPLSGSHHARG